MDIITDEYKIKNNVLVSVNNDMDGTFVIPDGVTEIGDFAFIGCINLRSVEIPSSVTEIGYCAFYDCTNLKNAIILNHNAEIAERAFPEHTNITHIKEIEVELITKKSRLEQMKQKVLQMKLK